MGAPAKSLAQLVMIGVTGDGPANVYFILGKQAAAGQGQDKEDFHGGGVYPITLTPRDTLFAVARMPGILP